MIVFEKILFILCMSGSVLYLFRSMAGGWVTWAEKKKMKIQAAQEELLKAEARAKEKAAIEQAKAATAAMAQLVQSVNTMQAAFAGLNGFMPAGQSNAPSVSSAPVVAAVTTDAATAAPSALPTTAPRQPATEEAGAEMSLEDKMAFLATTVMAQGERMEAMQATMREFLEASSASKRRAPRKGGEAADGNEVTAKAGRAKSPASLAAAGAGEPPSDGLDSQPPHDAQRQGQFDIVR
ncbi:hypothetical protein [Paracidovorax citrulli]|uniref:hypothetical protein n=1 Tax=Paracidovorax citrulli TaxID=80869 RepID=UPI003FA7D23E